MTKFFYLILVFLLSACGHGAMPSSDSSSNDYDAKAITSFSLNNTMGIIDGNNIYVTMPYGTDISSLIATYTTTSQEVIVNGVTQENKVTSNDFTNPVTYTVKAKDGSTHNYLVTVNIASVSAKEITFFALNGTQGVINGSNVYITMPYGTDLSSLTASYITTGVTVTVNNTTQINNQSVNSFVTPTTYTVHAADGSIHDYVVIVTVASPSAKEITWFSLNGTQGMIKGDNIYVTLPTNTDVKSLIASYITTGILVTVNSTTQINGVTSNDFTNPLIYTVKAEDGTTHTYQVTVTVASNTAKDILSFSLNGTQGVITGNNINIIMPVGYDIKSLIASYTTTGISVTVNNIKQVSGQTSNDYTNPITYTVYAEDGSTQSYTITVTVASNTAKDILSFSLNGTSGVIIGNNINVIMPIGYDVKSLTASYIITGTSVTVDNIVQVNGQTSNDYTNSVIYRVYAEDGTTQSYTVTVVVASNTAKDMLSFSLNGTSGIIDGSNISITMPFGTSVTSLIATYTTTGQVVKINNIPQVSEQTSNDFTNPIIYSVYAEDGTMQNYKVTVTVASNTAKDMLSFSLNGTSGIIDGNNINVVMPSGTNITSLIATYTTTGQVVKISNISQVSEQTSNDFTNPVIYTVYAEDSTTQSYTVTVVIASNTAKDILSFSLNGTSGIIDGNNIYVAMPSGTNISSLIATYITTGQVVKVNNTPQVSEQTSNDFTNPVIYTVYAEDGSTQNYTVIVTVANSSAKDILSFSLNGTSGIIDGNNVNVVMPSGTNISSLIATYTTTGIIVKINNTPQVSGQTVNDFTNLVVYTVYAEDGTTQDYTVIVTVAAPSANQIIRFSLNGISGIVSGNNIDVTMPIGFDVKSLTASYITTGIAVNVNNVTQMNGVTPNNFTNSVVYTVLANDGTTQSYNVRVTVASSLAKEITSFSLNGIQGTINDNNITVAIPTNVNINSLVASYITTGSLVKVNGVVQMNGVTSNSFANPVTYTVIAQDGTVRDYIVTVVQNSNKEISSFSINDVLGNISNNSITISMPYGTNVKSLVAKYITTGVKVQVNGVEQINALTPNNFTNPVTYRVIAEDGTVRDYIVTVVLRTNANKDMAAFSLNGTPGVISGNNISVTMPYGVSLKSLLANYVTTGIKVKVNGVEQVNGLTVNNFTNSVIYVVQAEDGTTQEYIVNVVNSAKYVAVGYDGYITTSIDGITWNKSGQAYSTLYGVTVNDNQQYVAVGNGGSILTSYDAINWQDVPGDIAATSVTVCKSTGRFVASGHYGYITTSMDGFNWSTQQMSLPSNGALYGVASTNNCKFVAVGTGGKIVKSENGTSWTNATSNTTETLLGITVNNNTGRFVAVGTKGIIITSLDGNTWTTVSSPLDNKVKLVAVTVSRSGRFIIVGDNNTILTSIDGINWTVSSYIESSSVGYSAVTVSKAGKFIAIQTEDSDVVSSYDGINWQTESSVLPNSRMYGITAFN